MRTAPQVRLAAIYPNSEERASGKTGNFSPSPRTRHALGAWMRAKENLQRVMRREDFQSFVRPMYLLAVLSGNHLLIALPPNRRVVERARNFRLNLRHAIEQQGYALAGFTAYPQDWELPILCDHDSFKPFIDIVCRGRLRKIEARVQSEDERDCSDLIQALEVA